MANNVKRIKNGKLVLPGGVVSGELLIKDGKIAAVAIDGTLEKRDIQVIDAKGKIVMPGMIDTHNHMCDPGPYNYREDWACGSKSAASGGITTICDMPLPCEPEVLDKESFKVKYKKAGETSVVDFAFWGGLTPKNMDHAKELHELGCIGFKSFMCFATETYPRLTDGYMAEGMKMLADFKGLLALHAENAEVAGMGCDRYSAMHCTDEACFDDARPWWTEYDAVQRAILFAENTGAQIQICHVSAYQTMELIKQAKGRGVKVYAETCPHYLLFDKNVLREKKSFAKCTPPFRSRENIEKMWDYVFDGSVDVLGTDHGPFTDEEKVKKQDFWKEYCGFGCNDVALAAMITEGVHKRGMSWEKLAALTSGNAAKELGLYPIKGTLEPGADADIVFIDPDAEWIYDGADSFSKTKTQKGVYQGMHLKGKVTDTFVRGECVYADGKILVKEGYGQFVKGKVGKTL